MNLLLIFFVFNTVKSLEVRYTETSPEIDGVIEDVWKNADSTSNFIQVEPYEGERPSERTVVYALQDDENLYIAFRCYADSIKPIACYTGNEDHIKIAIDPFGSKTTAYYFIVHGSNIKNEGWLVDDGRREDESWDGVWYRNIKFFDDRYEVEVKIPFKSIRYKKGLEEWGIQLKRYIGGNRESNYWTEVTILAMDMVSKFGKLSGIKPHAKGYYFELYPEGFIRYDRYRGEEGEFKPSLSLNFKWDLTSQSTLNATVNPDYAQIEADPFELNLDQYPIYLEEKRPFFLEGKDIFRMSDFGEGKGFYSPFNLFYSRKIGKSIDGNPIPIIGGLKITHKTEKWNTGALGAYTDDYAEGDSLIEPDRGFAALRTKYKILDNSDIGMLFSGSMTNGDNYNYAIGFDGVYRKGISQLIVQGALSDNDGKRGWAASSCYFGWIKNLMSIISAEVVDDSFDVSEMGYVPWSGRKRLLIVSGPFKIYKKGFTRNIYWGPEFIATKEPGSDEWSFLGGIMINPNFRNNWGFNLELNAGKYHEVDTNYLYRSINLSVWGNGPNYHINFGFWYGYSYNYYREYLAYHGSNWLSGSYTIIPQLSLSMDSNFWVEWDPDNTIVSITPGVTPRLNFFINADMKMSLFNEFVMEIPGTRIGDTELLTNRLGFLFSWNFRPKSWLYIALNDYRVQDDESNLQLENQIGAIKAKYLFYF